MSQSSRFADRRPELDIERGVEALHRSDEFRGPVEPTDGHHCNDHLAHIYESADEQLAALLPFVSEGLERGEQCLCLVDDDDAVREAMRDRGLPVDEALDSGALVFQTVEDTYLRGGSFDPDEMISFYADTIAEATREYAGVRVVVSMSWFGATDVPIESFMAYEAKVNDLFDTADIIAICQYDRRQFAPETLRDVVRTHPHLVYEDTVCHNFYYTPPAEFFGPDQPERDVDRMMNTLLERTNAKAALREQQAFLQRQHAITSDVELSFEEKLHALFELGREQFDVELGGLARIDREGDRLEFEYLSGDHEELQPGVELPLSETLCRRVAASEAVESVADTVAADLEDLAICREFGTRSYLGTHIRVDGDDDRTCFFVSSDPRDEPFTPEEHQCQRLLGQWVESGLERQQREAQLAGLNDLGRDLMDAKTGSAIASTTVEHAHTSLGLPLAVVLQYDEQARSLEPAARTPRAADELPTTALCDRGSGPVWEAFVADEQRVLEDVATGSAATDLTEVVVVPLGRQGVFVAATAKPNGFDGRREFVETTAATVESAFTRADREQVLQEREQTLEEQNQRLQRLDRINSTIRSISTALVSASSREEIEAVVCDQLAGDGPYELAWIGDRDPVSETVTAREWAGAEDGYLDDRSNVDDASAGRDPVAAAVDERTPQIVDDVLAERSFDPWRQAALDRGYHACIGLPLVYEGSLYGVLAVYASQPDVFDDLERTVLAELSDAIAHAINAVESKKALTSDEVIDLEFRLGAADSPPVAMTAELECEFSVERVVRTSEGGTRGFFTVRGATADDVLASGQELPTTDLDLVEEREEDGPACLFEAALSGDSLYHVVLEHGGRLEALEAADGEGTARVQIAADANVREFVDAIQYELPSVELVAQCTCQRPQRTQAEFRAALTDELTARQREVLQTAYFSGYFEQPRTRSSSEIARRLDIAQPTFTTHLRTAERKLCDELFEDALDDCQ